MKDLIEELETSQKTLRGLTKILKDWRNLQKAERFNLSKLQGVQRRAKKTIEEVPEGPLRERLLIWLKESDGVVRRRMEQARFAFGRALEKTLEREGVPLKGRMPKFLVGPYGLETDFERGRAKITFGYDTVKDNLPVESQAIAKALIKTKKEIERSFDPQRSVDLVFGAYVRATRILGTSVGERIPVMGVLQQLVLMLQGPAFRSDPRRENFVGFGRSQFAMMLYKIRASGALAKGRYALYLTTATFDATKKRENFLWIPDNQMGEGTTYAYVSFKESNDTGGGPLL
jgi:hypothetical protein